MPWKITKVDETAIGFYHLIERPCASDGHDRVTSPQRPGGSGREHRLRYGEMDEMSGESPRWQGPRSDFPWEEDALKHIRDQMPDAEPYRAWQTFTFTAPSSHVREVDLFLAAPGGLFLVEIKSHPGTARNNGSTWVFRADDRTRTIENPLHFTDSKAKDLRTRLIQAAHETSPQALHPSHRASRLPLRAEPPLRVRPVPARTRLRPGRSSKSRPRSQASGTTSSTSRPAATKTALPPPSPSSYRS